jgi:hypothetical protein
MITVQKTYFKQFQSLTMITYLALGITDGISVNLVSINVWRLAGDTLNITCNFLYCYHQVHRDFSIILYVPSNSVLWRTTKTLHKVWPHDLQTITGNPHLLPPRPMVGICNSDNIDQTILHTMQNHKAKSSNSSFWNSDLYVDTQWFQIFKNLR